MDDRHFGYITKLRKKKKKKKENPVTKASASSVSLRNVDCGVVWKKVTIIERRELWCRICCCLLPSLISALSLSLSRSSPNTFGHPLVSCALLLHLLLSGIDIRASQLYAYFEVRKSNADFRDAFLLFRVRILPSGFIFLAL
jgi:hypothetical protein